MTKSMENTGVSPLPHYAMPDKSAPPYDRILEHLQEYEPGLIGSSYFYISAYEDRYDLCRIVFGGGKIFFHELVNYDELGISEDDMEQSARDEAEFPSLPGYFFISPLIEQKLRVLYGR